MTSYCGISCPMVPSPVQLIRSSIWFQECLKADSSKQICLSMTSVHLPHKYGPHLNMFWMERNWATLGCLIVRAIRCDHSLGVSLNTKCSQLLGKVAWGVFLQEEDSTFKNSSEKQRSLILFPMFPQVPGFCFVSVVNEIGMSHFNKHNFTFFQSFPILTQIFCPQGLGASGTKPFS